MGSSLVYVKISMYIVADKFTYFVAKFFSRKSGSMEYLKADFHPSLNPMLSHSGPQSP